MPLLQLCLFLFLCLSPTFSTCLPKQVLANSQASDTIKALKKKSQELLIEKKYPELYQNFSFIANYYFLQKNSKMYFDYKNKALNYYSQYSDQSSSMDSMFLLIKNYCKAKINDSILTESIINNFAANYNNDLIAPSVMSTFI